VIYRRAIECSLGAVESSYPRNTSPTFTLHVIQANFFLSLQDACSVCVYRKLLRIFPSLSNKIFGSIARDEARLIKIHIARDECQNARIRSILYPFLDFEHARRCLCANTIRLTGDIARKLWFSFAIPIAGAHLPGLARVMGLFEEAPVVCIEMPPSAVLFSAAPSCIGGFSSGEL